MQFFRKINSMFVGDGNRHSIFLGYSRIEDAIHAMDKLIAAYSSDSLVRWNAASNYLLGKGELVYEDFHGSILECYSQPRRLSYVAKACDGNLMNISLVDLSNLEKLSLGAQLGIFIATTHCNHFEELLELYSDYKPDYIRGGSISSIKGYFLNTLDLSQSNRVRISDLAFQFGAYDGSALRLEFVSEIAKVSGCFDKVDANKYLITVPDSVMQADVVPSMFNDTVFKIPHHGIFFGDRS